MKLFELHSVSGHDNSIQGEPGVPEFIADRGVLCKFPRRRDEDGVSREECSFFRGSRLADRALT